MQIWIIIVYDKKDDSLNAISFHDHKCAFMFCETIRRYNSSVTIHLRSISIDESGDSF